MAKVDIQSTPLNRNQTHEPARRKRSRWLLFFLGVDLTLMVIILISLTFILISTKLDRMNEIKGGAGLIDYVVALFNLKDDDLSQKEPGNVEVSTPTQLLLLREDDDLNIMLLPYTMNYYFSGGMNHPEYGAASLNFYGIDFSNDQLRVILTIQPPDNRINNGKPILIPVFPAGECEFGEKTACVTAYKPSQEGNTIFMSIHSGVGGEAQRFRHAIEGTGIDKAGYSLDEVIRNLEAIQGADVSITQDDVTISGLKLMTASRVPAGYLSSYFNTPIPLALLNASSFNSDLVTYLHPDEPQLVIETCGWKMRGEPWADEVTPTTASIYLGVIQKE